MGVDMISNVGGGGGGGGLMTIACKACENMFTLLYKTYSVLYFVA